MLWGRAYECGKLDRALAAARAGHSRALALRGEAGIGKTALLGYVVERADGMQVLRTSGVESESELPYGGLAGVLRPLVPLLGELPAGQADALRAALALGPPVGAERFAVAAATLSLLSIAAEARPVLCVVDDLQWLDPSSAEAVLFAARRLGDEGVAVVVAVRDGEDAHPELRGLEEVVVRGLDASAVDELLREIAPSVAGPVVTALARVTGGNPLALRELAGALTPAQRSGAAPLDASLAAGPAVRRTFGRRLERLSAAAREALTLAAADSTGARATIAAALAGLGLGPEALDEALDAGLVDVDGGSLAFAHPLIRSVAYSTAPASARRRAHAALAGALEGSGDPRRAWHLADAASGPDAAVAAELDAVAGAAAARSDLATAARAFTRAADMTADPPARAARLLQAAQVSAGAGVSPLPLLDRVTAEAAHPTLVADASILRAMLGATTGQSRLMREVVDEAAQLREVDPVRAAVMLAFVGEEALQRFDFDVAPRLVREAFDLAGGGVAPGHPLGAFPAIAHIQCTTFTRSEPRVAEIGAECLRAVEAGPVPDIVIPLAYALVWADRADLVEPVLGRLTERARRGGSLVFLSWLLSVRGDLELVRGDLDAAQQAAAEGLDLAQVGAVPFAELANAENLAAIACLRGQEDEARRYLAHAAASVSPDFEGLDRERQVREGCLPLWLGRIEEGIRLLSPQADFAAAVGLRMVNWFPAGPELVEAHVRLGQLDEARARLAQLEPTPGQVVVPSEQALLARCRGLVAPDEEIDAAFGEALACHERAPSPIEAARTRLVYGERLRRARRPTDARAQLEQALAAFERVGAAPFADRARAELGAAGVRVRAHPPRDQDGLTPQEVQVAREVAAGKSNREVAAALFLSPKTIEMHLGRVYRKTGLRSRAELVRRVAEHGIDALATPGISP